MGKFDPLTLPSFRELLGFKPRLASSDNVDSEIKSADLANPPAAAPDPTDQQLVELVMQRFRQSAEARRQHEREWLLAKAFEIGNQWVEWRTDSGRLESLIDPHDRYRSYVVVNKIRPITTKLKARATMSKPDASVAPLTDSPEDQGAAEEARCILDHYDLLFDRQHQARGWVDSALATSTSFLKIFWDPTKEAWTPAIDAQKRLGKAKVAVGDIEEYVVPPFEVYADPKARSWRECGWLIHAKIVPLSYIQEKFGEAGYRVQGDVGGEWGAYVEMRLDSIQGDQQRAGTAAGKNAATLYEMWEKPTARYPKGRLIRVAGGQLLASGDWPYEKRDTFPFVPLGYQEKTGALWALNAVTDLIPLQRAFNNAVSRIQDRVNTDKPTILVREGSEIGLGAYQSRRNYEFVEFVGEPPSYQTPPPVSEYWFEFLKLLSGQMEDIAGVHEVSNGSVPPGVTAGNAIELLQQSDQTQMAEFVGNIESAQVERAEWEIALVAQFYSEPRIIGIQEVTSDAQRSTPASSPSLAPSPMAGSPGAAGLSPTAVPGMSPSAASAPGAPALPIPGGAPAPVISPARQPSQAALMLRYLSGGGQCRVKVTPGSATPKTPAARSQQILDLFHAGAFQPQNLPSLRIVTDLLNLERSDELNDRIEALVRELQDSQPNPAVLERIKQEGAQKQLAAQQHAAQQEQQMQLEHEAELEAIKLHSTMQLEQFRAQLAMQKAQADAQAKLTLQEHDKAVPNVTLTGQLDAPAKVSAENNAGLDGSIADAREMQQPKPAAPAAGSKPAGEQK